MDEETEQHNLINKQDSFNRAALACAAIAVVLGVLAMIAWTANILVLAKLGPDYIPMAPLTAIMFILIGSVLLVNLSSLREKIRKVFSVVGLVLYWILLLIKLSEFFFGVRFGIEYLFVRNPQKFGAVLSARISPITATAFILAGISIIFLVFFGEKTSARNAAGGIGSAVFLLSSVLFFGYFYGAPLLYGGKIIPVALTTALALLSLSAALILATGQSNFPLRFFVNPSAYALLLRAFLPVIIIIILTHELVDVILTMYVKMSEALKTALETLVISLVVGVIIFRISKMIGEKIDSANLKRKKAEAKIRHLAYYDNLTDIPNRNLFDSLLTKKLVEAKHDNKKLAVYFLDLDNFKTIKNTLGYDIGDKLLLKITKQLKKALPGNDIVGKIGEDEYLLFSPIINKQDSVDLAQKILSLFEDPWSIESQKINISANIGVTIFPDDGKSTDILEKNADSAMTSAKKESFNNFAFFEERMLISRKKASERLILAGSLTDAIKNQELLVYYQPIINTKIGEIIGAEALVRWQKPGAKLIMPNEFIPLAESTGQIIFIGNYVLKIAFEQSEKLQKLGFSCLITINLSAKQLMQKNWVEEIAIGGNNIILEVTESDIMKKPEFAIKAINRLKELEYMISIDDFGTGYASLSYLKKFSVDFIKIDKSFIDNIVSNRKDQAIVAATIDMAHGLGLSVTAEGVETRQQFAFLRQLNCDNVQGFLFSKPLPANEFENLLAQNKRFAA